MTMHDTAALASHVSPTSDNVGSSSQIHLNTDSHVSNTTIRNCVENSMRNYFRHLDGHDVTHLYQMVMAEVEAPLLAVVLEYTKDNQSRAAELLGLNRGTLRKKMKEYGLL